MPLVNPYQVFTKPACSITKRVKQLIGSTPNRQIKEFVQSSKFDSYQLPASQVEHLVSLSLPSDLPRYCLAQGYTHIHFGAIRLALTFHGRKGLPAYSRIALLDTRFVEYQHACIGTIQTTLKAGTIFVTFYPDLNMPLNELSLLTVLKAHIHIGGTPQVNTFQATFHYQIAYQVQNHSLDILVPGQDYAGDALLIDVDSNATPTYEAAKSMMMMKIFQGSKNPRSKNSKEGISFDPQSLPQSYTHTTSPSLNIWASEQRRLKPPARKEPTFLQESQSIADVVTSTKTPDVLPIQKVNPVLMFLNSLTQTDKPQNPQFIAPVIKSQKDYEEFNNAESFKHLFMAEPENAESTVQFDAEEYEENQENPNQKTPTEFSKSEIKQYFTFDDVPPSKWRKRSIEMLTCKKWKFIRKKKQRGRTSDMCFICQKRGHFARNCPDKKSSQALIQALNQVEPVDVFDLESLYSLNDAPSDSILCTIAYSDLSSDDDSDTYTLQNDFDFGVHMINPIPHVLPIQEDPPLPLAKIHLFTDTYAKPIPVIAFFNIASKSFLADDKFSLSQKKSLFQHLAYARVLSKFDLKSEFWQLEEGSSSNTTPTIPVFDLPDEIVETTKDLTFEKRAKLCYKTFLTILLKSHGLCINGLRPVSFLPPKDVNDDGLVVYHAPSCFIHDWYTVNPSSRRCERKLQILYTYTRSLMARANGVDPDKIPYHVMWNISIWSKDHLNAYKWIEANGQWLYDNIDHCEVETSDDDDDARSLWSSDDGEHFDPFEDDPTHPDARWSP
nr:viral movement protein [Tanacetum cinerariifolium]